MIDPDEFLPSDHNTVFVDGVEDEPVTVAGSDASDAGEGASEEGSVPPSVGRYIMLELVGKGGMGTVHSAFDPELERTVAVKLMYAAKSQERLRREAQAIARVKHPNVISVHDVGYFESGGKLGVFMVMELVDGVDLETWLGEVLPSTPDEGDAITSSDGAAAETRGADDRVGHRRRGRGRPVQKGSSSSRGSSMVRQYEVIASWSSCA